MISTVCYLCEQVWDIGRRRYVVQLCRLHKAAPVLLKSLETLCYQVEISGAIDPLGHPLKNLQALHQAREAANITGLADYHEEAQP